MLFKKNKVINLNGMAKIAGPNEVSVAGKDGKVEVWRAKEIVIATGSEIVDLPGLKVDEKTIVSSTGALSLKAVPKKMIVIGGGIIGLELVILSLIDWPYSNLRVLFGIGLVQR